MRRVVIACLAALALSAFGAAAASAHDDQGHSLVFPPHSSPYGQSYQQWAVQWFQRVAGLPTPVNPFLHPDNCGPGPDEHAWFLAGATGGNQVADCTVPEGKALLVSPLGNFCSGATNNVFTFAELRDCAFVGVDGVTAVRVRIDGTRIPRLRRFFLVTRKFPFDIPADNIFGVPAQTTPAVVIGEFLMIRPLKEGWHTVVLFAAGPFPDGFARIVFHVHVVEGQHTG